MLNCVLQELLPIILGFIQSHNMRDSEMLENLYVVFRLISSRLFLVINWAHKSNELVRDDPVQISVLYFLIILILLRIKALELVPSIL